MLSVVMLSVVTRFAECRESVVMLSVITRYAECRYTDWRYAECRYAGCHYTGCRVAVFVVIVVAFSAVVPQKV